VIVHGPKGESGVSYPHDRCPNTGPRRKRPNLHEPADRGRKIKDPVNLPVSAVPGGRLVPYGKAPSPEGFGDGALGSLISVQPGC
jgi:hypothetical protein